MVFAPLSHVDHRDDARRCGGGVGYIRAGAVRRDRHGIGAQANGDGGRYPGTFYSVGSVAVDSKGNVYTGENLEGKRVQKFIIKGGVR